MEVSPRHQVAGRVVDNGSMTRMQRSWALAKASWAVLKSEKGLLWLPVLSFIFSAIVVGVFALAVWATLGKDTGLNGDTEYSANVVTYVLGFCTYIGVALVQTYFLAALCAGANEKLEGRDTNLGQALGGRAVAPAPDPAVGRALRHAVRDHPGHRGALRHPRPDHRQPHRRRVERRHVPHRPDHRLRGPRSDRRAEALGAPAQADLGREPDGADRSRAHRAHRVHPRRRRDRPRHRGRRRARHRPAGRSRCRAPGGGRVDRLRAERDLPHRALPVRGRRPRAAGVRHHGPRARVRQAQEHRHGVRWGSTSTGGFASPSPN